MLPNTTSLTDIFTSLVNRGQAVPWTLGAIADFPFTEWTNMQQHYAVLSDWYEGVPLQETIQDATTGELVDKYPIQLNPIPRTCEKHCSVLFGYTLESIRAGGIPVQFIPASKTPEATAELVQEALKQAFKATGGGAMFVDNGITSQYMGGCVFQVKFFSENRKNPVQVTITDPGEFFGIPEDGNPWSFSEAWTVREITINDAKRYGYTFNGFDNKWFYVEHWTKEKHEIWINEYKRKSEPNPFSEVPFVYIPHIRTKNFIGKSIITNAVKGIIKEWNMRFADIGDAVSDDSHTELFHRGVRGNLKEEALPSGRKSTNLGSATGVGASDTQPDAFAVTTASASTPMMNLTNGLESLYRKETNHPAVADGEDEGSQRSAATLVARMWPLIAHIELERINWTAGLIRLAHLILLFYAVKKEFSITMEMVDIEFTIKWSTPLPRDREALVNELAIRYKAHMTSLKHILELLGDIEDIELEITEINTDADVAAQRDAAYNVKGTPGNTEGINNQQPGDQTNVDAGNISTNN